MLQIKESDFTQTDYEYEAKINNWGFSITTCKFPSPITKIGMLNERIDIDIVINYNKQLTLPEAVTAINDYLKQLYEEVSIWQTENG